MKDYYNYFSVKDYEIVEKKLCHTYGTVETPFMAYAVKTGNIIDMDGNKTGDIIKWMTQKQYEYITSYGEKDF